jgi:hypothetical protein
MTPSTKEFMNSFWAGAFLPRPLHWRSAIMWLATRFTELFSDRTLLRYRWPAVFALVGLLGLVVTWKRNRLAALLLCGPLLAALLAAIAHQYPFRGRLAFWMLPTALIAVASGIEWLREKTSAAHVAVGASIVASAFFIPALALAEALPPYEIEHHWEMLSYLQQHRQPGDVVYVMQLQQVGMQFYGERFGLEPKDWITGVCDADDARAYVRDVDRFRGVPRLWVLSGSGRPLRPVHAAVRKYLSAIGVRRDAKTYPSINLGSVNIELYDLSDAVRLSTISAEKVSVPAMPNDPKIGCREWTKPNFDWNFSSVLHPALDAVH